MSPKLESQAEGNQGRKGEKPKNIGSPNRDALKAYREQLARGIERQRAFKAIVDNLTQQEAQRLIEGGEIFGQRAAEMIARQHILNQIGSGVARLKEMVADNVKDQFGGAHANAGVHLMANNTVDHALAAYFAGLGDNPTIDKVNQISSGLLIPGDNPKLTDGQ